MFEALFFGTICLSAAALPLLVVLLARRPPGRGRKLAMAGAVVCSLVGTPVLLYILMVVNYLFFDAWHWGPGPPRSLKAAEPRKAKAGK